MGKLTLLTLNVNGLRAPLKRRALFEELRKSRCDIFFLQETHSTAADQKIWLAEWGADGFFSHGRSNAKGVCILFRRGFTLDVRKEAKDNAGRLVVLQIRHDAEIITLANIYAPTQSEGREQDNFIDDIEEVLAGLEIHSLFMGGDFNINLDQIQNENSVDVEGRRNNRRRVYAMRLNDLLSEYGLTDLWKNKNPLNTRGTFHRNTYTARLDYWFTPVNLTDKSSIYISPQPLSNHCMVKLEILFSHSTSGPGFWRFDSSLLADEEFIEGMEHHLLSIGEEGLDNPSIHWEWIKYNIRSFCIKYTIERNRERNRLTRELEDRLAA